MKIVLGVSGGIAAYKTPDLVRRLQESGSEIRVILTPNAARFVSPLSLAAVSGHGVIVDQWGDSEKGGVDHIELARWADLLLIAPATANILAKLVTGIADDALSTYAIAHRGEIAVAPAMNTFMLQHPTVTANLEALRSRGVTIIAPDEGLLACGDEGAGRMPDPPVIVAHVHAIGARRDLEGRRILVTAGPTREPIDPVRYLSNRSSGKMGYAIAEAAHRRGATVTLVSGPTSIPLPPGVVVKRIDTAHELRDAVMERLQECDVVIKAAAVADFTPKVPARQKMKKENAGDELHLELQRTPDVLAEIGALPRRPLVVAFAAETDSVEENARGKLERKNADLIVANDVSDSTIGFDSDQNEVMIIARGGAATHVPKAPKLVIAHRILDAVVDQLRGR
ncbi:MAG TPA: bifunctional phosphopantothenoylcysteine decarboxylase/phosphopantothenate--cysteine ligase CoaBC [Thermoanaerobaculia bacterium]|nr:bifunctional phosphopantothenoylcysteine decarboxylase/phosphopantothenate--cysteine ligase CoaBC [Thermoanaerobaculia bacterium]